MLTQVAAVLQNASPSLSLLPSHSFSPPISPSLPPSLCLSLEVVGKFGASGHTPPREQTGKDRTRKKEVAVGEPREQQEGRGKEGERASERERERARAKASAKESARERARPI